MSSIGKSGYPRHANRHRLLYARRNSVDRLRRSLLPRIADLTRTPPSPHHLRTTREQQTMNSRKTRRSSPTSRSLRAGRAPRAIIFFRSGAARLGLAQVFRLHKSGEKWVAVERGLFPCSELSEQRGIQYGCVICMVDYVGTPMGRLFAVADRGCDTKLPPDVRLGGGRALAATLRTAIRRRPGGWPPRRGPILRRSRFLVLQRTDQSLCASISSNVALSQY